METLDRQLEQFLDKRKGRGSNYIKKFLFEAKMKPYKCEECGIENLYNGKKIVLQLHHIDGNSQNNVLSNFQILCPNCHSQTRSFRSKKVLTDEHILGCCENSNTISDVIRKVERHPSKSLYARIEKLIQENNITIAKYSYSINQQKIKPRKTHTKQLIVCKQCNAEFVKKRYKSQYCTPQCSALSNIKYDVDLNHAIEVAKEHGWSRAAVMLGFNNENTLRRKVKNYIKQNKLEIDFYAISRFAKHSGRGS